MEVETESEKVKLAKEKSKPSFDSKQSSTSTSTSIKSNVSYDNQPDEYERKSLPVKNSQDLGSFLCSSSQIVSHCNQT